MTEFNFEQQMDNLMAANGIKTEDFAYLQLVSLAAVLQGCHKFIGKALPADLVKIHSEEEAEGFLDIILNDEALYVTTLRATALYADSKLQGKEHSLEDVQGFYDAYIKASDADREIAKIGTFRLFKDLTYAETVRCVEEDGGDEEILQEVAGHAAQLEHYLSEGVSPSLYTLMYEPVTVVMNLAQTIAKVTDDGHSLERALYANRANGAMNSAVLDGISTTILDTLTYKVMQERLPEDQFAILDALAERQAQGGSAH